MRDIRCIQSAATPLIVAPVCIWPCNMEQINMDVWYLSGCARARVCVCLRCIISGISLFYPLDTYIFDVYFFRAHRCTVRSYQVYLASCHHWKPCTGTMSTMLKREMCIAYAYNSPHDKHQPNAPVAQKSEQTNRKGIPREGNKSLGILFLCQQFDLKYTHFFRSMSLFSLKLALLVGYGALPVAAEQRAEVFFM